MGIRDYFFQANRIDFHGNPVPARNTKFHKVAAFICRRGVLTALGGLALTVAGVSFGGKMPVPFSDIWSSAGSAGLMEKVGSFTVSASIIGFGSARFLHGGCLERAGFSAEEIETLVINKKPESKQQSSNYIEKAYKAEKICGFFYSLYTVAPWICGGDAVVNSVWTAIFGIKRGLTNRQWRNVKESKWVIEAPLPAKESKPVGAKARELLEKLKEALQPRLRPALGVSFKRQSSLSL